MLLNLAPIAPEELDALVALVRPGGVVVKHGAGSPPQRRGARRARRRRLRPQRRPAALAPGRRWSTAANYASTSPERVPLAELPALHAQAAAGELPGGKIVVFAARGLIPPTPPTLEGETTMIPADDPSRSLTVANPDAPGTTYISLAGNTYAMLVTGEQTDGPILPDRHARPRRRRPAAAPARLRGDVHHPRRRDRVRLPRREAHRRPEQRSTSRPTHPHNFRTAPATGPMLCMCTPAGQDEYFTRIGDIVAGKDAPPPQLSQDELAAAPPPRRRAGRDLPKRIPGSRGRVLKPRGSPVTRIPWAAPLTRAARRRRAVPNEKR